MSIRMTHPATGGTYDAQPSQVPHLQASGWQVIEGQAEQGEVWPLEVQRFEGQPPVRLHHPDVAEEITVAESAVPFHRERGWLPIEPEVTEAEPEEPKPHRRSKQRANESAEQSSDEGEA